MYTVRRVGDLPAYLLALAALTAHHVSRCSSKQRRPGTTETGAVGEDWLRLWEMQRCNSLGVVQEHVWHCRVCVCVAAGCPDLCGGARPGGQVHCARSKGVCSAYLGVFQRDFLLLEERHLTHNVSSQSTSIYSTRYTPVLV